MQKAVKYQKWSFLVETASHFCIKLPFRYLATFRVRKIGDDTDNKGISKLTYEVHSEIGKTSRMEIFPKELTAEICKLFREKRHQLFNQVLNVS